MLQPYRLLIKHFLGQFNRENDKHIEGITPDAMDVLTSYSWPGNVREVRNVVERMVVLTRKNKLTMRDIPIQIREDAGRVRTLAKEEHSLEEAERNMIVRALRATGGNRTRAAEAHATLSPKY